MREVTWQLKEELDYTGKLNGPADDSFARKWILSLLCTVFQNKINID